MSKPSEKAMHWHDRHWPGTPVNQWVDAKKPTPKRVGRSPFIIVSYLAPDKDGELNMFWQRAVFNHEHGCWFTEASKNRQPRKIEPIKMMIIHLED